MTRPALDLSLRVRIAASMAGVLGALALVLVLWLPARLDDVARDWSERRAIGLSMAVGQSLAVALEFGDQTVADQRLALMSEFPDARYAALLGADGTRIGSWGDAPAGALPAMTTAPTARPAGELILVQVPLRARGGTVGQLVAAFDLAGLDAWRADTQRWIALSLLVLWIAGLGVSYAVGTVLARPLARVTEAATQLGRSEATAGAADTRFAHRHDEVQMLADAFERMAGRIKGQMDALERERERALDAEEVAVNASESKSRFLANMSHELRTPLNAIIGYCQLIYEAVVLDDVDVDEMGRDLGRIEQSGRHLLALINDVLDLSKIEAGKLEIALEPTSVEAMAAEAAAEVASLVVANGNRFEVEVEPDLGLVLADPLRVRQCLTNLLSNAAKFTHDGQVTMRLGAADGYVVVEVEDTGIGIADDVLAKLFQPFVQADASTTRRFGGTGLGLSLSRLLAERMGGDISVKSQLGAGSTFRLRLPQAAPQAERAAAP
ncbi:MAG: ATP-binding protein [Myxococcota bacterium]